MKIDRQRFDAILLDMDGVITDTRRIHADCWKRTFDEFLSERARASGQQARLFDPEQEYRKYVDGKPRLLGVADFLESRAIHLPMGSPEDISGGHTMFGLANQKSELFDRALRSQKPRVYADFPIFIKNMKRVGFKIAVVTSSKHCRAILEQIGMDDLFDAIVDGQFISEHQVAGKPEPGAFLSAAGLLGVAPHRAVVIEDSLSGVQAGARGGFGLVIGIARSGQGRDFEQSGANMVVVDLAELTVDARAA